MLITSVIIGMVVGIVIGSFFWDPKTLEAELGCAACGLAGIIVSISLFSLMGLI
jgi:hypothetical protein